ncbi:glycine zipper family protein [Prevotella sp. OH937_COT-195]|uniref:glycine zipper family protein n=1 Tax=Prevotella sp. OH937_COT-195 TaxID=2491051 RepID=UPI000F652A52|nr:glycine zipper family protein [Prevotella sp. OH937_COT-195]RRD02116.1 glycine zipper family protein [Prevotella sp. OH937_COT-195]
MKKVLFAVMLSTILFSGCTTYTGAGAYRGAGIGAMIGSAIGGITGGARGSDIGTLVGMAGGAAVGAAIGSSYEDSRLKRMDEVREHRYRDYQYERSDIDRCEEYRQRNENNDAVYNFENNGTEFSLDPVKSGDDRIYDYNDNDYNSGYSASTPRSFDPLYGSDNGVSATFNPKLEIRNARFVDDDMDNTLRASEMSKIIFEVYNNSDRVLYDVQPVVEEVSGAKHIYISPSIHVESIAPHRGIRYTATIQAGKRLKDGNARFRIRAIQGNEQVTSRITEFDVRTSRR